MKKKFVFFLPTFPDVMYSFLLTIARKEYAEVTIVCLGEILPERRKIFEQNLLSEHTNVIFYNQDLVFENFIKNIIDKNQHATFIFGGLLGQVGKALSIYNAGNGKSAIIITEKPSIRPVKRFNFLIKRLKLLKTRFVYSKAYKQFKASIRAIFVTGIKGVKQFKSYGIPSNKLFNFMYTHIDEEIEVQTPRQDGKIRFVYVGRFEYLERGLDNLIACIENLSGDNWSLDLVGGYGKDAEQIIDWAQKTPNVQFAGSWQSNQVINNLQKYDICISPTKMDGWRIQVNQAILAGIATITTDQAISDELVTASNSGLVVNAFSKKQLYKALVYTINNFEQVQRWKVNAKTFQDKISNEKVAQYFVDSVEYCNNLLNGEKPKCPWG